MANFWVPLGAHIFERSRIHQRKANEENICLRITEWPQSVVVLLAGRVPQTQIDRLTVHHNIRRIIVEAANAHSLGALKCGEINISTMTLRRPFQWNSPLHSPMLQIARLSQITPNLKSNLHGRYVLAGKGVRCIRY
jgi:hypothetical protein